MTTYYKDEHNKVMFNRSKRTYGQIMGEVAIEICKEDTNILNQLQEELNYKSKVGFFDTLMVKLKKFGKEVKWDDIKTIKDEGKWGGYKEWMNFVAAVNQLNVFRKEKSSESFFYSAGNLIHCAVLLGSWLDYSLHEI